MWRSAGLQEFVRQPHSEAEQPVADDQEERTDEDEAEACDVVPPPVAVVPDAVAPDRVEVPERFLDAPSRAVRAELVADLSQAWAALDVAHHPVGTGDGLDQEKEHPHQTNADNCRLRA